MIGKSITELDSVDSTSNYIAKELEEGNYQWGTVILAHYQTHGRGQRAANWQSRPGDNLTFSFALSLKGFDPRAYFTLSRAVSLALVNALATRSEGEALIKWPNDILINRKKVAGILIENRLGAEPYAICGIGLNVNQTQFDGLPHVTSLKLTTDAPVKKREVFETLLGELNREWGLLSSGDFRNQKTRYEAKLFGLDRQVRFEADGSERNGYITGTTDDGQLLLKSQGYVRAYRPKTVKLLY